MTLTFWLSLMLAYLAVALAAAAAVGAMIHRQGRPGQWAPRHPED